MCVLKEPISFFSTLAFLAFICNVFTPCRVQHELEVSTKQAIFVDSSISDTIRTCIVMGNHRAALKVKNEFKVSIWRIPVTPK